MGFPYVFFYGVKNMFKKCEYIISAVSKKQYPNISGLPEYVLDAQCREIQPDQCPDGKEAAGPCFFKAGKTRTVNFI